MFHRVTVSLAILFSECFLMGALNTSTERYVAANFEICGKSELLPFCGLRVSLICPSTVC